MTANCTRALSATATFQDCAISRAVQPDNLDRQTGGNFAINVQGFPRLVSTNSQKTMNWKNSSSHSSQRLFLSLPLALSGTENCCTASTARCRYSGDRR